LVNNAGMLEAQTRLENIDAARLHRVFATNVTGSFLCAREAVKRLSTRHGG
ncbi:SDR family NAD(P)-dependent oxidoreductase, partial [Pseudomonas aeruginosa]